MRCRNLVIIAIAVAVVATNASAQDVVEKAGEVKKRWQDLIVGEAAIRLGEKLELYHELQALKHTLLPPKGAPRSKVESLYGKSANTLKANNKEPSEREVYQLTDDCRLYVSYEGARVRFAYFGFQGARWYPISRELGKPTYTDVVHDLELKVRILGAVLEKLYIPSNLFPWPN